MNVDRRYLLIATVAAAATSQSGCGLANANRVTQDELDEAIRLHGGWLENLNTGQRCVFTGRDLSGLQLGKLGGVPIDLNGADFTQANLSGTNADNILVHHCNFNGAKFDGSHWRRPVFAFADMRRASAKQVKWGTPSPRDSADRPLADFSHAILRGANLAEARICGYFYGTKLVGASLVNADLSLSDFLGPVHHEMNFSRANLCEAKLRHCHISSANFSKANCSHVDFSHSIFSDLIVNDCNLRGAIFVGAEFERTVFSPYQIDDTELRRTVTGEA
jgi:uncharacterized protein YjbI with pentapeptide repeats